MGIIFESITPSRFPVQILLCFILHIKGIPFFHAGDEILRSKSLDRDSYNSGDWFNRFAFSFF